MDLFNVFWHEYDYQHHLYWKILKVGDWYYMYAVVVLKTLFFNGFSSILDLDLIAYIIWDSAFLYNFAVLFFNIHLIETCINLDIFYLNLSSLVRDSQGMRHIRGETYRAYLVYLCITLNLFENRKVSRLIC